MRCKAAWLAYAAEEAERLSPTNTLETEHLLLGNCLREEKMLRRGKFLHERRVETSPQFAEELARTPRRKNAQTAASQA